MSAFTFLFFVRKMNPLDLLLPLPKLLFLQAMLTVDYLIALYESRLNVFHFEFVNAHITLPP